MPLCACDTLDRLESLVQQYDMARQEMEVSYTDVADGVSLSDNVWECLANCHVARFVLYCPDWSPEGWREALSQCVIFADSRVLERSHAVWKWILYYGLRNRVPRRELIQMLF